MASTWQNPEAAELHQTGLALSLGGEFEQADEVFRQTSGVLGDNPLELGHLYRDWARVHAGMGSVVGRRTSINAALCLHTEAVEKESTPRTLSELGATMAVRARIHYARSIEEPKATKKYYQQVSKDYEKALDCFADESTDPDYLSQVLSYGSVALAATNINPELRDRFIEVGTERTPGLIKDRKVDFERSLMIDVARGMRRSRALRFLLIKSGAVDTVVAGPYIIKSQYRNLHLY